MPTNLQRVEFHSLESKLRARYSQRGFSLGFTEKMSGRLGVVTKMHTNALRHGKPSPSISSICRFKRHHHATPATTCPYENSSPDREVSVQLDTCVSPPNAIYPSCSIWNTDQTNSTALRLVSSLTVTYFWVVAILRCPVREASTNTLTPCDAREVKNVLRPQCALQFFSPARL